MTNLQARNQLESAISAARAEMLSAWKAQSMTTAEEGASYAEATEAIRLAKAAQVRYYELLNAQERLLYGGKVDEYLVEQDEYTAQEYEWSTTPIGGY